jgi:membrane protein implicated in regulation of membrane protease activity
VQAASAAFAAGPPEVASAAPAALGSVTPASVWELPGVAWRHPKATLLLLALAAALIGWRWLRRKAANQYHKELPSLPRTLGRLVRLISLEERRVWQLVYLAGELGWFGLNLLDPAGTGLRLQLAVLALLLGRSSYVFRRRGRVFAEMFKLAADKCKYPKTTRNQRGADLQRHRYVRVHRWVETDKVGLHTIVVSPEMDKGLGRIREDFEREWTHTVPKPAGRCLRYVWLTNKDADEGRWRKARLPRVRAVPVADIPKRAPWPGPMTEPPIVAWRDPAPLGEEVLAWLHAFRKGRFEDGTPVWPARDLWQRARHGVYLFPAEDLWRKFALGLTIGNQLVLWDPVDCPHMLIAGPNKTGKSNLERLLALQALARPDQWRVIGFDPLGVELGWLADVPGPGVELLATSLEDIAVGFRRILREIAIREARCQTAGVNNVLELKKPPPMLLVLIDEVTVLLSKEGGRSEEAKAEDALKEWMSRTLAKIALTGRKYGVYLVLATQRPDVSLGFLGAMKAQLHARLATAYMDSTASRMVLDNTRATELPDSDKFPGRSLVQFDSRAVVLQAFEVKHGDAMRFVGPPADSGAFPADHAAALPPTATPAGAEQAPPETEEEPAAATAAADADTGGGPAPPADDPEHTGELVPATDTASQGDPAGDGQAAHPRGRRLPDGWQVLSGGGTRRWKGGQR